MSWKISEIELFIIELLFEINIFFASFDELKASAMLTFY